MTKAQIYNFALADLLLSRRITDTATDQSNENRVLNLYYDLALEAALADCDLDSTAKTAELTLVEETPNDLWDYCYTYPSDCVLFRRIVSQEVMDNRDTHIPKKIVQHEGSKRILTNEADASAEYISNTISLTSISSHLGLCIAAQLAILSAPLLVGKGAKELREKIEEDYKVRKAEAQERDRIENFNYVDERIESELVAARLE